ncbi:MarR family winged helix-turn-helix transcriptional regulator [Phytoactinopolyspora limicola]|uniref:MarR family winged helix-turn-helix transcriptional regulator n=1 Tax=Phytoactinopolyspora limicola TaxID=2715536 RepID=UPI001A9CB693|nr:MarR family transcriptional regulator [Phytoactinopolyspora limicola]
MGELSGPSDGAAEPADAVNHIVAQWRRERPDLDVSYMQTMGRIAVLTRQLARRSDEVFGRHGITQGEFDVLTTLRRAGSPYTLMPSELAESLMMSRAGMTSRLDRLEKAGYIERALDAADRRSFRVSLTDQGRVLADAALADVAAEMNSLVARLETADREVFERSLRTLIDASN